MKGKARKVKDLNQKKELNDKIQTIEKQRSEFVVKSIDTKHKLREINKLLKEEKRQFK